MKDKLITLPSSWDNIEMSKLTSFATGKKDVNQGSSIGKYPFFTCSKKVYTSEEFSFDKEALLIAGNGDVGTVHYYKGKFEAYQRTYILSDFNIDVQYLYQYLKYNLIKHLTEGQSGTTIQFIKISQLKNFKILKPNSSKEQFKIAEILSKVDKAIRETELLIEKQKRIKIGLIQDLLTKGIDKKGNIRSEETHEFIDSPVGKIPKEWKTKTIGKIYDLKSGLTPLRSNKKYFAEEGHNWVKTLDLNEDNLYNTEEKVTEYALLNTSLRLMPIGSILIAMYGGWEQIGRTAILKKEAATNQAITCLSNPKFEINCDFVQLILQYYRFKWKQFAVSTRKDPNISKSDIENFIIPFPKDINEQNIISDKINVLKNSISNYSSDLNKLKSIKTGLMQDLLSGKKRVTHLIN